MNTSVNLVRGARVHKFIPRATYILLGINIVCFLVETVLVFSTHEYTSIYDWIVVTNTRSLPTLIGMGALMYPLPWLQSWRLVTYMFLHAGVLHITLNGLAFFSITRVEREYGWKFFLLIYFTAGIVGGLAGLLLAPPFLVGASGALYGILIVETVHDLGAAKKTGDSKMFRRTLTTTIIFTILFMLIGNFFTHLAGALVGVAFALFLKPNVRERLQWVRAGEIHLKAQRYEEAAKAYDQAISADSEHAASSYVKKGEALIGSKRLEEGITSFERGVALDPHLLRTSAGAMMMEYYTAMGEGLLKMQRYDQALTFFEQALSADLHSTRASAGKEAALGSLK